jgi:serine/threonine-protein kinase RsbW
VSGGGDAGRTFPARASELAKIRAWLRARAARASFDQEDVDQILVAATEACTNVVVHSGSSTVEVRWASNRDGAVVEVHDRGKFRRRVRVPQIDDSGGYGIPLMTALMDEVDISEGTDARPGTRVRLVKRRAG